MAKRLVTVTLDENVALPEGSVIKGVGQIAGQKPFLLYEHTVSEVQTAVERYFTIRRFAGPGIKIPSPDGLLVGSFQTSRGELHLVYELPAP